jgi:hypothetical protein
VHSWVFAFSHPLLCAPLDSRSAVASIASRGSQPTSTFSDSPSCARREVHLRYAVFRWVFASLPRDFLRFSFAMLAVASMQDLFIASCPLCVSVCAQSHFEGLCVSHTRRLADTRHACIVRPSARCFSSSSSGSIHLPLVSSCFVGGWNVSDHHSPQRVSRHRWHAYLLCPAVAKLNKQYSNSVSTTTTHPCPPNLFYALSPRPKSESHIPICHSRRCYLEFLTVGNWMKPSELLHQPLRTPPPHLNPSCPFPLLQADAAAASVAAFAADDHR